MTRYEDFFKPDADTGQVTEPVVSDAVGDVLRERGSEYGDPWESFDRIAGLWSQVLPVERRLRPSEVALCMAGLKMARLVHDPLKEDSWVDFEGYVRLGRMLATELEGGE